MLDDFGNDLADSPPKKKPAPVDTVALKQRIASDARRVTDRARTAGELDAKGMTPQGNAAMQGSMDDMQRLVARQDSLEVARGKAPSPPPPPRRRRG